MKVLEQIETTYKPGSSRLEPWACRCCVCNHFALRWVGRRLGRARHCLSPWGAASEHTKECLRVGWEPSVSSLGVRRVKAHGRGGSPVSIWATNWLSLPKPGNSSSPPAQSFPTVVLAFSGKALSSSTWRLQSCAFPGAAPAACLPGAPLLIFVRLYMLPP